jgi:hypothetical protein
MSSASSVSRQASRRLATNCLEWAATDSPRLTLDQTGGFCGTEKIKTHIFWNILENKTQYLIVSI